METACLGKEVWVVQAMEAVPEDAPQSQEWREEVSLTIHFVGAYFEVVLAILPLAIALS